MQIEKEIPLETRDMVLIDAAELFPGARKREEPVALDTGDVELMGESEFEASFGIEATPPPVTAAPRPSVPALGRPAVLFALVSGAFITGAAVVVLCLRLIGVAPAVAAAAPAPAYAPPAPVAVAAAPARSFSVPTVTPIAAPVAAAAALLDEPPAPRHRTKRHVASHRVVAAAHPVKRAAAPAKRARSAAPADWVNAFAD